MEGCAFNHMASERLKDDRGTPDTLDSQEGASMQMMLDNRCGCKSNHKDRNVRILLDACQYVC